MNAQKGTPRTGQVQGANETGDETNLYQYSDTASHAAQAILWTPDLHQTNGGPLHRNTLGVVLSDPLEAYPDACLLPYVCDPPRRLGVADAEAPDVQIVFCPVDLDSPSKKRPELRGTDEMVRWQIRQLELAESFDPPPAVWESPSGGLRLLWSIEPGSVRPSEYNARCAEFIARLQAHGFEGIDPTSAQWTRYQRLPHGSDVIGVPSTLELPLAPSITDNASAVPPVGQGDSDPKVVEFAAEWLRAEAPPAVEGQNGHASLLVATGGLLVGFGLDGDTAMDLLVEHYNPRCEPPWLSPELETQFAHKIEQVHSHGSEAFTPGQLLQRDRFAESLGAEPSNDVTATPAPVARPSRLKILEWDAIMAPLGPVPWLCDALGLAPGRPSMFLGKAGSGKTWSVQAFAVSVAAGVPAFGRFPLRQGPVLHLDLDQGSRATLERYQELVVGAGLQENRLPLRVAAFGMKITDKDAKAILIAECAGHALCVIDSLRGAATGDENSTEFAAPLTVLAEVSEITGCTFVVLHHEGHADRAGADAVRGSTAITAASGAILRFARPEEGPCKITRVRASEFDVRPPFVPVHLELSTGVGHCERLNRSGVSIKACAAPQAAISELVGEHPTEIHRKVLDVVRAKPGLAARGVITELGGGGRAQTVRGVINTMLTSGELHNAGTNEAYELYSNHPREIVYDLVPPDGSGATVGMLAELTRLKPNRVKGILDVLNRDGRVISFAREGDTIWMRRPQ